MKNFKQMRQFILSAILLCAVGFLVISGETAFAKTITTNVNDKYVTSVGSETYLSGVTNLKINGKSAKKMKKKVKTVQTNEYKTGIYIPASYYDEEAYASEAAYEAAKSNYKYKSSYSYTLRFLKAGTYTISYDEYDYGTNWVAVPGKNYEKREVTIYKTHHTRKIKVLKNTGIVSSISLGKTKMTYKNTNGSYAYSYKRTKNRFLSGNSGKLTVKMNSNYAITSIIVKTYDKDGKEVYTAAGNKTSVNYGQYAYSYTDEYDKTYLSKSMYKPTEVYIGYKNKFTGEYTKYSVAKDTVTGRTYVNRETYYGGDDKTTYKEEYVDPEDCSYTESFTFYKK